jgi:hypothetical protein
VSIVLCAAATACTALLDYGPTRQFQAGALYHQDAEAKSGRGRCDGESPPFRVQPPDTILADCDSSEAPLEGSQSMTLTDEGRLACDPCWAEKKSLWVTFDFRVDSAENYIAIPFELATGTPADLTLDVRRTGALVSWGPEPALRLYCGTDLSSGPVPLAIGVATRIIIHFDFTATRTDLWTADLGADVIDATSKAAAVSLMCNLPVLPTSWLSRAIIKPSPGHGAFSVDAISVAETREALTP